MSRYALLTDICIKIFPHDCAKICTILLERTKGDKMTQVRTYLLCE